MLPPFLRCAALLLLAGTLLGQGKTEKKPAEKKPQAASEQIAPDDMVIVIAGACQTPPGEFAVRDCIRGVTREEFEALVAATNPKATPELRERLAESLGRLIILSNEAKKRGLLKNPEVRELLRLEQMQELAALLLRYSIKNEASQISEGEVEEYYRDHIREYESADLWHVSLPRKNTVQASEEDQSYAESLRARCGAGEDLAKLEAEADERAGQKVTAPVHLKDQKRITLSTSEQAMFDMRPGACAVFPAGNAEFHLYRLVAITTPTVKDLREAIVTAIETEKQKEQLDALRKTNVITLNSKYFKAAVASEAVPGAKEK